MIKAIQAIQNIKKNPDNNFLLVGDNDFLYLYIKNLIKESNGDFLESVTFDCSEKASVQDDILNSLSAIDLFQSKKIIIIKNINKISKKNRDLFINSLSNNENSNIIVCTDNSFLGFIIGLGSFILEAARLGLDFFISLNLFIFSFISPDP